jgi:F-box protein 9
VGDFARLALVCKHFAYLVAAEQRIWRRVCLGDEFGFQAMHYHWQSTIEWQPLDQLEQQQLQLQDEDNADGTLVSLSELADRRREEIVSVSRSLVADAVYPDWKHMFRSRPRVRFNGCYISTVNYVRTGQASTNQLTWGGAPIHIVTYYRYLRFFRDGTAISLLTTTEPTDVVHQLTRENLELHRRRGAGQHALTHLPSVVMQNALRGRWRLSSALDHPDATSLRDQEGDLFVETEGVDPKYMYRMHLTLRSAGKLGRNNKAAWRSFHSYNKLTDDWAEFGLKNDKAFFFSRVKSYGVRGA